MAIAAVPNVWGNPERIPQIPVHIKCWRFSLQPEALGGRATVRKVDENARLNLWGDHDQGCIKFIFSGKVEAIRPNMEQPQDRRYVN